MGINSAIASYLGDRRKSQSLIVALVAEWLGLLFGGLFIAEAARSANDLEAHTLLLVQPNFKRSQRWDPVFQEVLLKKVGDYTSTALESSPNAIDLVIWPENILNLSIDLESDDGLAGDLAAFVDAWNVPLVTGLVRPPVFASDPNYRNSSIWWSPNAGYVDAMDKVRAIPLIESSSDFPGRDLLAKLLGSANDDPKVAEAMTASSIGNDFLITPALCFEILFPHEIAARRDPNSVAILNLADDSWVEGETVDRQILAAASFRAVEQRLPVVRVGHGGLSGVIDSFGRKVTMLPPDQFAHATVKIESGPPPSISEKAAIISLPIVSGSIAVCCFQFFNSRRSRSFIARDPEPMK